MKRLVVVGIAATLAAAAVACGGGSSSDDIAVDETITIDAQNVKFVPSEFSVPSGKTVKLVLVNKDKGTEHDLASDDMMVRRMSGGGHGGGHDEGASGDMMMLAVHSKEGESSAIIFRADKPGTYAIHCTIPGHKDAGMVGTITVT